MEAGTIKKHHQNHPLIEIQIVLQLLFAQKKGKKRKKNTRSRESEQEREKFRLGTNWTSYLKCFITSESITL